MTLFAVPSTRSIYACNRGSVIENPPAWANTSPWAMTWSMTSSGIRRNQTLARSTPCRRRPGAARLGTRGSLWSQTRMLPNGGHEEVGAVHESQRAAARGHTS